MFTIKSVQIHLNILLITRNNGEQSYMSTYQACSHKSDKCGIFNSMITAKRQMMLSMCFCTYSSPCTTGQEIRHLFLERKLKGKLEQRRDEENNKSVTQIRKENILFVGNATSVHNFLWITGRRQAKNDSCRLIHDCQMTLGHIQKYLGPQSEGKWSCKSYIVPQCYKLWGCIQMNNSIKQIQPPSFQWLIHWSSSLSVLVEYFITGQSDSTIYLVITKWRIKWLPPWYFK